MVRPRPPCPGEEEGERLASGGIARFVRDKEALIARLDPRGGRLSLLDEDEWDREETSVLESEVAMGLVTLPRCSSSSS